MSEDIKVGDICVIVAPASPDAIGLECEVIGDEKQYERKVGEGPFHEIWYYCIGFMVRTSDGRRMAVERICLRKKRPPADPDEVVRQATMPRADFDRWLQRVREQKRVEEPA